MLQFFIFLKYNNILTFNINFNSQIQFFIFFNKSQSCQTSIETDRLLIFFFKVYFFKMSHFLPIIYCEHGISFLPKPPMSRLHQFICIGSKSSLNPSCIYWSESIYCRHKSFLNPGWSPFQLVIPSSHCHFCPFFVQFLNFPILYATSPLSPPCLLVFHPIPSSWFVHQFVITFSWLVS